MRSERAEILQIGACRRHPPRCEIADVCRGHPHRYERASGPFSLPRERVFVFVFVLSLIYLFLFRAHCHLRIPDVVQVVKNDVAQWGANEREGRRGEFSSWEGVCK